MDYKANQVCDTNLIIIPTSPPHARKRLVSFSVYVHNINVFFSGKCVLKFLQGYRAVIENVSIVLPCECILTDDAIYLLEIFRSKRLNPITPLPR